MVGLRRQNMAKVSVGGIGLEMLAVAFIVLKLVGVISWSWWWVLAPVWAPIVTIAIFVVLYLIANR